MFAKPSQGNQTVERNEQNPVTADATVQLGWLLVMGGLISADVLEPALQASRGMEVRLGEILVETGKLAEHDVDNALAAQRLVMKGLLDPRLASKALGLTFRSRLAFDDAVARASWIFKGDCVDFSMAT